MDWIYGQIVGFLGNFFALMDNIGDLDWVNAIVLFFSRLGWAIFAVSVVVCAFECGVEYSAGRGNLQQCALNVIKGFLAVSLFTVVPVRLYALSVSLQGLSPRDSPAMAGALARWARTSSQSSARSRRSRTR